VTKPRRRQAGEGGISEYRTKSGIRYWAKYRIELEDGTTREVLKRGFLNRKAAADFLTDKRAEIRKGVHVLPSNTTVAQFTRVYLDGLRLAPSTSASYRKNFRLHVLPEIGNLKLTQLTGTRLSALYRKLETSGRKDHQSGKPLSARTIRYIHTTIKAMLSEAVRQGLLIANPADKATPPAAREAKAPEIHPWTAPQLALFLAWAKEHDCSDALAWEVLAFTGMRRGELLALEWRDLDTAAGRLSVRRSAGIVKTKGEDERLVVGPPKNGRQRVVDLDAETVDALRRYRSTRAGLDLRLVRDNSLIFGDLNGDHLNPDRFSRRFTRSLAQARRELGADALPMIRVHDLRHTCATLMLANGVSVKVVSERLGHTTTTITTELYVHVLPGMQAAAAAGLRALVGSGS
jgi:integrase